MAKIGNLPEITDLQNYINNRIKRFESELNPSLFDNANEVIRAQIVELKNVKIIADGVATNNLKQSREEKQ